MTNEEIKQALKEAEEQFQNLCEEHWRNVRAIQEQCKHESVSYSHGYLDAWEEHYFTSKCCVCGEEYDIQPTDKEFDTLWLMYANGEIE